MINPQRNAEVDWVRLRATTCPDIIVPAYPQQHNARKGSKQNPCARVHKLKEQVLTECLALSDVRREINTCPQQSAYGAIHTKHPRVMGSQICTPWGSSPIITPVQVLFRG